MNTVFCDGGLSNRLNSLIFALILREKFGHRWQIAWPRNNWCGAAFDTLFECDLPVIERTLEECSAQENVVLLIHDVPLPSSAIPSRVVRHSTLHNYENYGQLLAANESVLYDHHLIPAFASIEDIRLGLSALRVKPAILERARKFCVDQRIDGSVLGLHIRKTDFGGAVNDEELFQRTSGSASRYFVCSDDRTVNERFAQLPNCSVFPKTNFPQKMQRDAAWQAWTTDSEGRQTPFNIDRSEAATVEGLIDLLILSRTQLIKTSNSTFLNMAGLFNATEFFTDHTKAQPMPLPPPNQGDILNLVNLVRPWHMNSDSKVRVGADADGGYVLPSVARRSNLVLSIGIGNEVSFDRELSSLGARVYQYDHTIPDAPLQHPNIRFFKQGWGAIDSGELLSLRSMIRNADWSNAQHPLLKFDTEGAEWDCLLATDSADLARFEIITGEFHDFHQLTDRGYFDRVHAVFSKLAETHHVVHLHANNAGGLFVLGGIPFPRLLELTYLRKDAAIFGGHSNEPIPGPLDRPNVPQLPDLYLRTF